MSDARSCLTLPCGSETSLTMDLEDGTELSISDACVFILKEKNTELRKLLGLEVGTIEFGDSVG